MTASGNASSLLFMRCAKLTQHSNRYAGLVPCQHGRVAKRNELQTCGENREQ